MSHGVQGRSAFDSPVPQISPVADPRESATIVDIEETPTQTYNARGHPENATSRTLTRQGRRAQNEVLSTVGVCVYVDENGKVVANSDAGEDARQQQRETTLAIIQENEVGLSLEVCDIFVHYAVTNFIDNIRKRIQVLTFLTLKFNPLTCLKDLRVLHSDSSWHNHACRKASVWAAQLHVFWSLCIYSFHPA